MVIDSTWTWNYKDSIIKWAKKNAGANEGNQYTSKNHIHLGFRVKKK